MAHCKKFTMAACGHMFKHYERAKDKDGEYVKFGNQDIDTSKSHLNYNLAPKQLNGQGGFIKERCSEVKMQNRKDVNVMCSWVVTAPKEVQENNETEVFFRETYKFLSERYGRENIVSAYVHMDETTPHIHFAFVPVVTDKKKNILKVSAKEAIDKKELQSFHGDLLNYMVRTFGRDMGILNEATKEGNQSIEELKRGTAKKELEEIKQQVTTFTKTRESEVEKIRDTKERINTLKEEEKALEKEIKALEKTLKGKQLTVEELEKIQPIKGWFGIKNITVTDVKNLKKMSMTTLKDKMELNKAEQEIERLKGENEKLEKQVPTLEQKMKQAEKEIRLKDIEKEKQQVIEAYSALSNKYNLLVKAVNELPEEELRIIINKVEPPKPEVEEETYERDRGYEIGD